MPDGTPQHRKTDNTLIKALARAFDEFVTITESAARESIAPPYMLARFILRVHSRNL